MIIMKIILTLKIIGTMTVSLLHSTSHHASSHSLFQSTKTKWSYLHPRKITLLSLLIIPNFSLQVRTAVFLDIGQL